PLTDLGGKTCIFSHPVYLFLREFSLQDFRGGSARRRRCRKTTGRTVCLIRSFDYDRTYSGCVWQRTRQFHDHEDESGPVFNPIKH
ncbi:hypothetical protein E4534_14105, partial [Escherichia coli]|nr:hypothetical protein [Escherichia coli]